MAPKSTEGLSSFPQLVYPSLRDGGIKDAYQWIKGKAMDDGAEGLWRVGDKLYDVSDFIKQHPGGQDWLYMTRGTDITEVFEIHHFSRYPEQLLSKFYIRDAKTPRNSPFTFKEDGFYKTLKNRVREEMKKIPDDQSYKTRNIMDFLVLSVFIFSVLMVNVDWWLLKWTMCTMAGLTMAWTSICAHNFMHKKDNWRMYTFNLGFMACDEWRISHVLSHHVFPNMLQDYEMSGIEPMLQYLPRKDKSLWIRYAPYLYSIVIYFSFCMTQGLKRLVRLTIARNVDPNGPWFNKGMRLEYLVPFTVPLAMSVLSRVSFGEVMWSWMAIVFMNSIIFGFIGLNAAHHHPEIFHDGDAAPRDTDWGIFQLISVMDRRDINSSLFLVMTNFGDHIMHHLFPTLDHTLLPLLYPVAEKTCEEFKQKMLLSTQAQLIVGQFQQLSRNVPLERTEIKRTKK